MNRRSLSVEKNGHPLLCRDDNTNTLSDGDRLLAGQAICTRREQEAASLTTTAVSATTFAFGLDWEGRPTYSRQDNNDDEDILNEITVLWQMSDATGAYLELDGRTGRLVLVDDILERRAVWGIGGCGGDLDGSDLAPYQVMVSEDQVELGILQAGERGGLWSVSVDGRESGTCPPLDLGPSTSDESQQNDGLQVGGMIGIVLGAICMGILLGLWFLQYHPSLMDEMMKLPFPKKKKQRTESVKPVDSTDSSSTAGMPERKYPFDEA